MARIRESLRHGASVTVAVTPVPSVPEVIEEKIPYVEVGACQYFEASDDVLATAPARNVVKVDVAAGLSRPHNVLLRALPSSTTPPVNPRGRFAPELVSYHAPGQPASARYSDLLTALLEAAKSRAGMSCRTVLLTAARSGVGTTTVLLNLAISAARQDRRVVVVDANLRRPAVAQRLGLPSSPGLTEVLAGELTLSEALQQTAQRNLVVLAGGEPRALLADEESVRGLVQQLENEHDLVLIDGPRIDQPLPSGRSWEGRAVSLLASMCQALYLVVPPTETDNTATTELAAGLAARALPVAGCIVAG